MPPKYQRIADDLRERIEAGEFPADSRLPSKSGLMAHYGVALNTVDRAIDELRKLGRAESIQGVGTFVREPPPPTGEGSPDIRALGEQVARLDREVRDLAERAGTAQAAEFAQDLAGLSETIGHIEVNLIDLYGKLGYDYPQGGVRGGVRAVGRHGRQGH